MSSLPDGTVTFLFSDVEGSTQLLERHGAALGTALARHHALFEAVIRANDGVIFETVGDAVYAAFQRPQAAVSAALAAHAAMAAENWGPISRLAVRISLHTGPVERRGSHYFGSALFRAARLQSLGYGEQTLVSSVTAAMAADDLPPHATLRDLGTHRLKDLAEPEHVYQLDHPDLRTEFPPPKSLDSRPNNLPLQLSSFVGRERELKQLGQLVSERRQVTVLGPGGIGKTRLALQAAADHIEDFADGVFFLDLAPLETADLIIPSLATTLGLREEANRPLSATVASHLRDRTVLLVLDNLEHLLPAASGIVAELAAAAPNLRILATSRAPLRIRGEQTFDLPGLESGRVDTLEAEPPAAVALLLDRASANGIELELTAELGPIISAICSRLDGLPLAIELAAARLRIFSVKELHDRLANVLSLGSGASDLPERQRTLRAAIAWTEKLLSESEQKVFARLGVFPGGFTLQGAAAVAGDISNIDEVALSLVDQSLVRRAGVVAGSSRFGMLEMVREYAVERLEESTEGDDTRDRLARHLLKLAEELEPALTGAGQEEALQRLDAELPSIRLTLGWLRDREDDRLGQLTAPLTRFWAARGLLSEAREWVRQSRSALSEDQSTLDARLLHADGMLAGEQGELSEAATLLRAAADTYRENGDRAGLTRVLVTLSSSQQGAGMLEEAVEAATEAAELAHVLGDLRSEASATGNLAIVALKQGRVAEAQAGVERAVEMLKRAGDRLGVVIGLGNLGAIAAQAGDLEHAVAYQTDALANATALNSPDLEAWARINLAGARYRQGEHAVAASLAADAIEQLVAVEDAIALVNALPLAAALLASGGDVNAALRAWTAAQSNAQRMEIELEIDDAVRASIAGIGPGTDGDAQAAAGGDLTPAEAAILVVPLLRSATF